MVYLAEILIGGVHDSGGGDKFGHKLQRLLRNRRSPDNAQFIQRVCSVPAPVKITQISCCGFGSLAGIEPFILRCVHNQTETARGDGHELPQAGSASPRDSFGFKCAFDKRQCGQFRRQILFFQNGADHGENPARPFKNPGGHRLLADREAV